MITTVGVTRHMYKAHLFKTMIPCIRILTPGYVFVKSETGEATQTSLYLMLCDSLEYSVLISSPPNSAVRFLPRWLSLVSCSLGLRERERERERERGRQPLLSVRQTPHCGSPRARNSILLNKSGEARRGKHPNILLPKSTKNLSGGGLAVN